MPAMDRRLSPRLPVDLQTTLTILGDSGGEDAVELPVRVENVSGNGAQIRLLWRLPVSACVKLVLEDSLYLGEVAYCHESDEGYQAGLVLEHAVHSLHGLQNLMRSLQAESVTRHRDCESRPGLR